MKSAIKAISIMLFFCLLSGCKDLEALSCTWSNCAPIDPVFPSSTEEIKEADYGIAISQDQAQRIAQTYLNRHLKDPRSAQYDWGTLQKSWAQRGIYGRGERIFGYKLDVDINAKNSYGGYTGFKKYRFMFYNDGIKAIYTELEGQLKSEIYYDSKIGSLSDG